VLCLRSRLDTKWQDNRQLCYMFTPATLQYFQLSAALHTCSHLLHCNTVNCQQLCTHVHTCYTAILSTVSSFAHMFIPATLQYCQLSAALLTCSHLLHCNTANCQPPLHNAANFHCISEPWVLGLQLSVMTNFNITVFTLVPTSLDQTTRLTTRSLPPGIAQIIPWSFKYCLSLSEVAACTPQSSNSGVRQRIVLLLKMNLHITSHYLALFHVTSHFYYQSRNLWISWNQTSVLHWTPIPMFVTALTTPNNHEYRNCTASDCMFVAQTWQNVRRRHLLWQWLRCNQLYIGKMDLCEVQPTAWGTCVKISLQTEVLVWRSAYSLRYLCEDQPTAWGTCVKFSLQTEVLVWSSAYSLRYLCEVRPTAWGTCVKISLQTEVLVWSSAYSLRYLCEDQPTAWGTFRTGRAVGQTCTKRSH
jgi:hypothetical protein